MAETTRRRRERAVAACCPAPGRLRARATKPFVALFRALADETRLEIVGLLAAKGTELCVCDIEGRFELGQPTISHHLRILREAGVVTSERRGTWVYYELAPGVLERLVTFHALLRKSS
jgi:ArsR family transcriptional regulator, arsenate/arsenite/antimonite-responsive transcriptional repressor